MKTRTLLPLVLVAAIAPTSLCAVAPAADGFVVAKPDGTVVRSTGFTVFHVDAGRYEVDSVPSVHACAYSVTAGSGDNTVPPRSFATAVGRRELHTAIMVATYDGNGDFADMGFHLIVRC